MFSINNKSIQKVNAYLQSADINPTEQVLKAINKVTANFSELEKTKQK
jgi:hypothetical protein